MDKFKITKTIFENKLASEIYDDLSKNQKTLKNINFLIESALLTTNSENWIATIRNIGYTKELLEEILQSLKDTENIISGYQKYLSEKESPVQEKASSVESKE